MVYNKRDITLAFWSVGLYHFSLPVSHHARSKVYDIIQATTKWYERTVSGRKNLLLLKWYLLPIVYYCRFQIYLQYRKTICICQKHFLFASTAYINSHLRNIPWFRKENINKTLLLVTAYPQFTSIFQTSSVCFRWTIYYGDYLA